MARDEDLDDDQRMMEALFRRLPGDSAVVQCGSVFVDVPWSVDRIVACADGLCMGSGGKKMKKLAGKTCCTTFRVPLTTEDVERIVHCVDEVKKIRDVGAAIEKAEGWWHHDEDGLWLERRKSGACVFLSAAKGERPWCTIHEWAVNNGKDWRAHKPEGCCIFPLYLIEYGDDVLVTSYGSPFMLEVDTEEPEDIETFKCTAPPEGVGTSVLIEQQEELEYRLGKARWTRTLAKLRKLGHAV